MLQHSSQEASVNWIVFFSSNLFPTNKGNWEDVLSRKTQICKVCLLSDRIDTAGKRWLYNGPVHLLYNVTENISLPPPKKYMNINI